MNNAVRITIFVVLIVLACLFGRGFYTRYSRIMDDNPAAANTGSEELHLRDYSKAPPQNNIYFQMMTFGGLFFVTVVILGLFAGHTVSQYIGARTVKTLYDDNGEGIRDPEYEQAEQVWANGDALDAIRLMRVYLQKKPRAQFAALRIAEIYEKDLNNPLAAILEYEEVLKQNLPAERWGWTAIHLCNLYNRSDKTEQAAALLRRIVTEYGKTSAAIKARKRLVQIDPTFVDEAAQAQEESADIKEEDTRMVDSPAPVSNLPPGFRPRKT